MRWRSLILLLAGTHAAFAQAPSRLSVGVGVEGAARFQVVGAKGQRCDPWGEWSAHAALRIDPVYENGWRTMLRVGLARDLYRYALTKDRRYDLARYNIRFQTEAQWAMSAPWWRLAAAIGVDWNIAQVSTEVSAENGRISPAPDLAAADYALWQARRFLIPFIAVGPVIEIPTGRKPVFAQVSLRQNLLSNYETPVAIVYENGGTQSTAVIAQQPSYLGLSLWYYF